MEDQNEQDKEKDNANEKEGDEEKGNLDEKIWEKREKYAG